ncbi:MAG: glycosyltransferase [Syntrophobacteraceae bacterium]|nr:glycosyltransferase [Desulfobacteraceae bacterium]
MPGIQQSETAPLLIVQVDTAQDETTGDFYYRTYAPTMGMARCEDVYPVCLTNLHRARETAMRTADVLVLNNVCDPDVLPLIKERRDRNRPTVFELCDDLDDTPEGSPTHAFYRNPENLLLIKRLAHYCDAMQFSSPELQRKYGYLNSRSMVFPNQILDLPPERKYRKDREVVVGWGGSLGHLEDMKRIAGPLMRWIRGKNNARLHLMCGDKLWALFDDLPGKFKKRIQPGSMADYYRFVSRIDIGIAPLKDTPFNRSRSDVKFLEFAAHGVVPVLQAAGPYPASVRNGETGFLFHSTEEMLGILDSLVEDFPARTAVARAARDYVARERLQVPHARERVDFYRSILSGHPPVSMDPGGNLSVFESLSRMEGARRRGRHLILCSTRFELLLYGGLLASNLSDSAKAAHMFAEAATLEPGSHLPHLYGAFLSDDVLASLARAGTLNPRSVRSRMLLGEEYARRNDMVNAMDSFRAAAEIFPQYELPFLKVAGLLREAGREQDAIPLMMEAKNLMLPLAKPETAGV